MNQPSAEWVEQKKKEFGKLRSVVIAGETYVYRMLSRPEYLEILNSMDPNNRAAMDKADDMTVETCVIWPEKYKVDNTVGAGIPTQLASHISEFSGFMNQGEIPPMPEEL